MALQKPQLELQLSQLNKTPHFSKTHLPFLPPSQPPILTLSSHSPQCFFSLSTRRRDLNLSLITFILSLSLPISTQNAFADDGEEREEVELEKYVDAGQGFTLLKPSSYLKVEKAGATVLFEEVNKGANNVGVVVSPVRISSLRDFGTPQFVADKLIQAEKKKESTKDAEVVGVSERTGLGGLPVYEFEYLVDSTRGGMKRIFSAAFVSGKKLYLLNISHADKSDSPLDSQTRTMLEQVLHSFDAMPST